VAEAFVFSAHGGNAGALADAAPALRAAAPAITVHVFHDHDAITARLHAEAAGLGVAPEAAGHHAGEIETSIVLAIAPERVRTDAFEAGVAAPTAAPASLFYPDLRANAPRGVVGDPRGASAVRGARYLAAWVELLVAALRDAKKSR
jgi:creatinine amidohydrolase